MRGKRGQGAFEYLTTYGWVVFLILIAIGALLYFDLGGMVSILPERCWFGSQLVCEDYSVQNVGSSQTQISFRLRNNFQEGIQITGLSYVESGFSLSGCNAPMIGTDEIAEITCTLEPALQSGDKSSIPIEIAFRHNESASKPIHSLRGEILIKVQ